MPAPATSAHPAGRRPDDGFCFAESKQLMMPSATTWSSPVIGADALRLASQA